jgi:hypothetical protein
LKKEQIVRLGYSKLVKEMAMQEAEKYGSNAKVRVQKLSKKEYEDGGMMAKGGKLGMPEWAVTITSENGDSYDWDGFAKNEDDAVYKAEKQAGFESVESGVNMLTDENGKKIEYKKGGTVKKKTTSKSKPKPSKKVGKSIQDKHRFAKPAGWRWKEEAVTKKIIERKQLAMSPMKKMRDKYPDYVYYEDRLNKSDQNPTRTSKDSI